MPEHKPTRPNETQKMITSKQNERIKQLRKLQDKKHRDACASFMAEGEDLVLAALAAGVQPVELFCAPDAPGELVGHERAVAVESEVLDSASGLGSGARVIGVFEQTWGTLDTSCALTIFLDSVSDPGNVGTVVRAATALADGPVVLGPGCADPYAPKAVRAAMGSIFHRPPVRAAVAEIAASGARIVALDGSSDVSIATVAPARADDAAIVCIGAERKGLSSEVLAAADVVAAIPMIAGGPESLNAAVAASIALYELGGRLRDGVQKAVHADGEAASATGNPATNEK